MATTNRLRNKQKHPTASSQMNTTANYATANAEQTQQPPQNINREQEYEGYYQIAKCNPLGVNSLCNLFPASHQVASQFNFPLGFEFSPVLSAENEGIETMNLSLDMIPQCSSCRNYMNCYNQVKDNKFRCFLCQCQNTLPKQYNLQQSLPLFNHSIYQTQCPANFYSSDPDPQSFVFFIDISPQSSRCKALYYCIAAMKQTLSRPDLDDVIIYFFTYDETVQEYDFEGEQVMCIIYDKTIQSANQNRFKGFPLSFIRTKLLNLLDSLQQISNNNKKDVSNFTKCFDYIFKSLAHTNSKFFILQCSESITGQQMFWQRPPINKNSSQSKDRIEASWPKPASLFETANKSFMTKYSSQLVNNQCSFSLFLFCTNFKNVKIFSDFMKLSSADIKVYSKDKEDNVELNRFYYELMYLVGTPYCRAVNVQIVPGRDWYFTGVYGNFRKLNQRIIFNFPYYDHSRKIIVLMSPTKYSLLPVPYCSFQIVTKYRYKQQCFAYVATIVQAVTANIQKLYESINLHPMCSAFGKMFLSVLRMQSIQNARKQVIDLTRDCYRLALKHYKKQQNVHDSIISIISCVLAALKNPHTQPEMCHSTPLFDRIVAERNFLQYCGFSQIFAFFNPYLFDLNNMSEEMCQQQGQFVYPNTIELKFCNTQQGIFLMDAGLHLYLFIAKSYNPDAFHQLFGKKKQIALTEELLQQQDTELASKVKRLVQYIREQRSYGWVPLYIVKCGQGTSTQRSYYMKYYGEKYDQFRLFKYNLPDFLMFLGG